LVRSSPDSLTATSRLFRLCRSFLVAPSLENQVEGVG
jgi:hypothetical protein